MSEQSDAWDQLLGEKLIEKAIPTYHTTKAEIVEYYQQRKDAGEIKSWRKALVHDLAAITGKKEKNLQRRFDPSRVKNPEKKNAAQYEALGLTLGVKGYKAPPGGFKVSWGASIWISKKAFDRSYSTNFTGEAAQALLDNPRWSTVLDAYFTDGGQRSVENLDELDPEQNPVEDIDVIDYLIVDALEE